MSIHLIPTAPEFQDVAVSFATRRVERRDRHRWKALDLTFRTAPVSFRNSSNCERYAVFEVVKKRLNFVFLDGYSLMNLISILFLKECPGLMNVCGWH